MLNSFKEELLLAFKNAKKTIPTEEQVNAINSANTKSLLQERLDLFLDEYHHVTQNTPDILEGDDPMQIAHYQYRLTARLIRGNSYLAALTHLQQMIYRK